MNLYAINTGFFKLDGGAMFGAVPKTIWNKLNPSDENNLCDWALRSMLIEDGNRLILVDNGIGDKQSTKFLSYYYLHGDDSLNSSLAKHGFNRDDITDVLLTHLHFDHCGGSIIRKGEDLVPAFKNATYWSNERHWKWATEPNEREKPSFLKENILPIRESGQLKMVDGSSPEENDKKMPAVIRHVSTTIPHLSLRFVYGHTDAMMLPQIIYKENTIVFVSDLFPSTAHIPVSYIASYDVFPLTALNEKKLFLNEAIDKDYILFFQHDPVIECCNLKLTEKGIRMKDSFSLKDIG